MRSLVLGSEGFVGVSLCRYLEKRGDTVVRFDVARAEAEDARSATLPLDDVDNVYFLAWDVGGSKYLYRQQTQLHQMEWNIQLLSNAMFQLRESGTPVVFVSSQLAENVSTVYGVTKRLGEVWTELLGGARVRLWNVYGPLEPEGERAHVVGDFVRQAVNDRRIQMLTDGSERRQFIHIDDVCRGLVMAQELQPSGLYDITSFEWVEVRAVADLVATHAGAEVIPGTTTGQEAITPSWGRLPGWHAEVSLEDGLRDMVAEALAARS